MIARGGSPPEPRSGDRCPRTGCGARINISTVLCSAMAEGRPTWIGCKYPVCMICFAEMTFEQLLLYYRALWLSTEPTPADIGEWFKIEALVLAGEVVAVPMGRGTVVGKDE